MIRWHAGKFGLFLLVFAGLDIVFSQGRFSSLLLILLSLVFISGYAFGRFK